MNVNTISVGKLLPNIAVTVEKDDIRTDFSNVKTDEISSNVSNVEFIRRNVETSHNTKIYLNKSGGFATGLDLLSKENSQMLDRRAQRFGIDPEKGPKETISSLYESMGIDIDKRYIGKMKNIRLDAIHVRGVNHLNTDEVFNYFQDYGPNSIEWINDYCCNVLWFDEMTCARAMLGLSKPLPESLQHLPEKLKGPDIPVAEEEPDLSALDLNDDKEKEDMEVTDDDEMDNEAKDSMLKSVKIPVPPGIWRLAAPHSKGNTILMRFATKGDKKLPGAEKRSVFYQTYGNPNYGGLKGLISSSKKQKVQAAANRKAFEMAQGTSSSSLQAEEKPYVPKAPRHKFPRMRMYADDEELRIKKSRAKSNFPERKRHSVHSRLGSKYTKDDLCRLGTHRDLEEEEEESVDLRSKLKRLRGEFHGEHSRDSKSDDDRSFYSKNYYKRKHRSPLCVDSDISDLSSDDN